jgi:Domain of unknown function (DUF397)
MDDDEEDWRASSQSFSNGNCIEVASGVRVRDSKDRRGPILTFSAAAWWRFISDSKK